MHAFFGGEMGLLCPLLLWAPAYTHEIFEDYVCFGTITRSGCRRGVDPQEVLLVPFVVWGEVVPLQRSRLA